MDLKVDLNASRKFPQLSKRHPQNIKS